MIPHYHWCRFSLELLSHVLKPELLIDITSFLKKKQIFQLQLLNVFLNLVV